MTSARRTLLCAGLLGVGGCATNGFHQAMQRGAWEEAASIYASDTLLHSDRTSILRAATLHADPQRSVYDVQRARILFARARRVGGDAPLPPDAERLATLLDEVATRDSLAQAREDDLHRATTYRASILDSLRQRIAALARDSTARDSQQAILFRVVDRLEGELRVRDEQIRALQRELEQLKAIDFGPTRRPEPVVRPRTPGGPE